MGAPGGRLCNCATDDVRSMNDKKKQETESNHVRGRPGACNAAGARTVPTASRHAAGLHVTAAAQLAVQLPGGPAQIGP